MGDLMGLVHRRSAGGTLALMNEAGLTMAQMVALYVLDYAGPQSVTAVASFLNLSPAATSHLVDRLVVAGFVGRTEDQVDRRQKRVAITPAGRALAARVHQERAREFASALALVTPELQRQFARILGRVVEELRRRADELYRRPRSDHEAVDGAKNRQKLQKDFQQDFKADARQEEPGARSRQGQG